MPRIARVGRRRVAARVRLVSAIIAKASGKVHAEVALARSVDVDDCRVDFHEVHGLVQILDDLLVVAHAVKRIRDKHRIHTRIGDDTHAALVDGGVGCLRTRLGLGALALCRQPMATELFDRRLFLRHRLAAHAAADHHGAEHRGNARNRDRLVHAGDRDVLSPGVLEREDAHDDLFALHGRKSGRGGFKLRHVARRSHDGEHVVLVVDRERQFVGKESRGAKRFDQIPGRSVAHGQELLDDLARIEEMNLLPCNVIADVVCLVDCREEILGRDVGKPSADAPFDLWGNHGLESLGASKAREGTLERFAVGVMREPVLKIVRMRSRRHHEERSGCGDRGADKPGKEIVFHSFPSFTRTASGRGTSLHPQKRR